MKKIIKFLLKYIPRPLLIRLSYIFRVFTPVLYRGNNVECPVCEKKFSKFLLTNTIMNLQYIKNYKICTNKICNYNLLLYIFIFIYGEMKNLMNLKINFGI